MNMKNKVWFVTGASKGLGLSLVKELLNKGYNVAATSRNLAELGNAVGNNSQSFLPLQMDLVDTASVAQGIQKTIDQFGRIDVIVNNAGYGLVGAIEELTDEETRLNFDVNVFGTLNVLRAALPYMRKQGSGHILNVASVGGLVGTFPGFGIYCATKFAMHGFSESLSAELKEFGIHVTVVSPGYLRTNFLGAGSLIVPKNEIQEYSSVRNAQNNHQHNINGAQPGDPDKAASVIIEVASQQQPPLHLYLGADAYGLVESKLKDVKEEMEKVKALATSINY
ncbi:short-subunit dehydrogenase [Pseudobacter ginsenosidimutans]|uniref:Short-subunit dehydrogenase n=2 Tax=Pseudobacter ginsenosidimutans TaxID=661488 RepID=A0A4Q7MYJ3_9BACT|nr:short-subunit dehydrogenase [Pseudobacter ginsenosidimutans]